MKPEIITWFYDRHFHINDLIMKRNKGVRPTQVKAAMKQLYKNYDGKNIGLGHTVQRIAKEMRDEEIIEEELELARAHEKSRFYRNRYERLKNWTIGIVAMWVWLSSLLIVHFFNN